MDRSTEIQDALRALEDRSPKGFALAFHIKYTTPDFLFQTYPGAWIDQYSQKGYVMLDPTVRWGFENTGAIRWSVLTPDDGAGVLADAASHGLKFGMCFATETGGSRSVSSFARDDREFSDEEIADLSQRTEALHALTAELGALSPETAEELRNMAIRFTHPGALRDIDG